MSAAIITKIRRMGASDGYDNVTNYPDALISDYIDDARLFVPVSRLGAKSDLALGYYTCHLMYQESATASSSGGSRTKEKIGDVEVTYSAGGSATTSGASDKYLDLYKALTKSILRGGPLVLNGR